MLRWRSWKEISVTIKSITLLKKGLWKVFNVILLLLLLLLLFTKYSQLSPCGHSDNTDSTAHTCIGNIANNKGRTIRKLIGGGGGAKNQKNIRAREN